MTMSIQQVIAVRVMVGFFFIFFPIVFVNGEEDTASVKKVPSTFEWRAFTEDLKD